MWKTSPNLVGPIYQMTRLMSTVGMALGPQVVKPFLGHNETDEGIQPIQLAYLELGALDLAMAIILIITSAWFSISTDQCNSIRKVIFQEDDGNDSIELIPDKSDSLSKKSNELSQDEPTPKKLDPCSRPGRVLVSLICWSFIMNAGATVMYTTLLYTYLYEYLGWTVDAGTSLISMFNIVRFIIGAIVVPVSRWVTPTQLVVVDMASLLLSSIMMLVALIAEDVGDKLTGAGIMVASVGTSNLLPTLISLAEESIYVTAPVMSLFIAANGVGLVSVGPLAGALLNSNVVSYPSLILALVLAGILGLAVYYSVLRWLKRTEILSSCESHAGKQ